jgi:hypothetical protein
MSLKSSYRGKLRLKQRGKDKPYLTKAQKRAARRVLELSRIYYQQYPNGLPHNGLGVKYAKYYCRTAAFLPDDRREQWLKRHAGWMDASTRDYILRLGPYWYSPQSLGDRLELYDEGRERCRAWSIEAIDVNEEQRRMINKEKDRKRKENRRRKDGAMPREQSLSRTKPWEAEGISRSTWERRRRKARDANSSGPSLIYSTKDELASSSQPQGTVLPLVAPAKPQRRRPSGQDTSRPAQRDNVIPLPKSKPLIDVPSDPGIIPGGIRDRALRSAIARHQARAAA